MEKFYGDTYRNYLVERINWLKALCEREEAEGKLDEAARNYEQLDYLMEKIARYDAASEPVKFNFGNGVVI